MTDLRPFRIAIDDADLDDLRRRLAMTRWPDAEVVDDWSQGIPLAYVQDLCAYWADGYDWRATEARLNEWPQFVTEIDGLDIHFVHVRSPHPDATPLVLTHGWPGSIVEFSRVIGPLTDPVAHGGSADDAFHVVCPSLPGYGFSAKPTEPGWGTGRIADAWITLMDRLGYDHYVAQGGDWGSAVTTLIGARDVEHCIGIHLNMTIVPPTDDDPTDAEAATMAASKDHRRWGTGYSRQQSSRPQTLGYGLADSPAAQCAWIVEKFHAWTDNDGLPDDAVDRDHLLDNVMMYWLTNSGTSSARLYWESFGHNGAFELPRVPLGCSVFPAEIFRPSRRWVEAVHGDRLVYFNELDRGGHFAAFEVPDLFVSEIRTFRTHL